MRNTRPEPVILEVPISEGISCTIVREIPSEKTLFKKLCARDSLYKAIWGLIDEKNPMKREFPGNLAHKDLKKALFSGISRTKLLKRALSQGISRTKVLRRPVAKSLIDEICVKLLENGHSRGIRRTKVLKRALFQGISHTKVLKRALSQGISRTKVLTGDLLQKDSPRNGPARESIYKARDGLIETAFYKPKIHLKDARKSARAGHL
ncbi:hypothetical protein B0H14DRAFT_3713301 [Mycena olivaceomarginata]|nr:hypothetical protein B0H14DRAFT_3713301 [Mycena olivaceomarginata]